MLQLNLARACLRQSVLLLVGDLFCDVWTAGYPVPVLQQPLVFCSVVFARVGLFVNCNSVIWFCVAFGARVRYQVCDVLSNLPDTTRIIRIHWTF